MTKHYSATFTDGTRLTRTTAAERTYTHAWRVRIGSIETVEGRRPVFTRKGFGGSLLLAHKAAEAEARHYAKGNRFDVLDTEVVPVVEHATRQRA